MARIPDEVVARLKAEVSLQRLVETAGIGLKRHGADWLGLCPFHDDRAPSLVVSPEKNLWHCLGACQTGGSVIDWVMKAEGVSFRHAVELLQNDYRPLAAQGRRPKQATVRKLAAPVAADADDAQLLGQVIDYYHAALKQSPEALAYLEKRGIANAEAIDTFKLGFANRTLGYRLPQMNRKAGAELRGQLQKLGVLRASGHEARVLIAYDRDAAGDSAAAALASKLLAEGLDCYRVQVPKGMDVNDYARQVTPASKALGVLLRAASWLGKGQAPPVTTVAATPSETPVTAVRDVVPVLPLAAAPATVPEAEPACALIPVLPASPMPPAPHTPLLDADARDNELVLNLGDRRYRLRGLDKNGSFEVLKVNVLVARGEVVHVDTFDLYQSRARAGFIKQAALELGVAEDVIKADLGRVLLKCEALQEQTLRAALALLTCPTLLDRIVSDFAACGIVGEATNSLVGYLAAVSRKLESPLAVIIQSTSAAGKSALMEALLRFVPTTDKVQYSAMTGQSLFYMGETDLQHKVLAIAEEEGAAQASYALKLLQSEGEVTIASTGKDETTGELVTKEYRVEGPVMLLMTTAAIDVDEELLNRCLVLSVNEARAQTEAIHAVQRHKRTLDGLKARGGREALVAVHQHAQRLLKPLAVVNPYAEQLTFLSDQTRTRRDHEKYLTLIDAIALLHQYQRPIKTHRQGETRIEYVEVTVDDIAVANRLAHEVLGRTLDELPPQTRRLLQLIDERVGVHCLRHSLRRSDYRFSRREVREATRWSDTALKVHLARLVEMEYLLAHRGGRGQSFVYELVYDGGPATTVPHLSGLIDVSLLKSHYDAERSGAQGLRSGRGQPPARGRSAGGPPSRNDDNAHAGAVLSGMDDDRLENAHPGGNGQRLSYAQPALLAAAE